MIRVAVSGAGGKLAGPIIAGISAVDDLELSGLFNPNRAGSKVAGLTVTADQSDIKAEVIIETPMPGSSSRISLAGVTRECQSSSGLRASRRSASKS